MAKAEVRTKPVLGHDGVIYNVLTIMATGRGWHERCLYVTEQPAVVRGKIVGLREHNGKAEIELRLDKPDLNLFVQEFSERPYVSRRTGVRNPHVPPEFNEPRPLGNTYGAMGRKAWFPAADVREIAPEEA